MRIKIEKVAESPNGLAANPRAAHVDGQPQNENFSLPLEYTIEGELIGEIAVGNGVLVERDMRNGLKSYGMFATTVVMEVTDKQFKTRNSVYNYSMLTT